MSVLWSPASSRAGVAAAVLGITYLLLPSSFVGPSLPQVAVWAVLLLLLRSLVDLVTLPRAPVYRSGAVLITGASTGIGKAAAVHLAEQGYTVFAGVRKQADADKLTAVGLSTLLPITLDVMKEEHISQGVVTIGNWCAKEKLPLVAVINNAGLGLYDVVENYDMGTVQRLFHVNVLSILSVCRAFIPLLRSSKGRIINMGSVAGFFAAKGYVAYAGSKAALEGMTEGLRRELFYHNISVSIIRPGYVRTEIIEKMTQGMESAVNSAPEPLKKEYPWMFDGDARAKRDHDYGNPPGPETTTNPAIMHALTSARPLYKYTVAKAAGFPAPIVDWMVWGIPTPLLDAINRLVGA